MVGAPKAGSAPAAVLSAGDSKGLLEHVMH
jgi:hypothetical protein